MPPARPDLPCLPRTYFSGIELQECFYIFDINSLSVASFTIIFPHSEGCLFTLLIVSFVVQKLLSLIMSHLFIFAFISNVTLAEDGIPTYTEQYSRHRERNN